METDRRIPTDGLVLRGYYNAITLVMHPYIAQCTQLKLAWSVAMV